ncbi:MAG: hypothetical protein Q8O03_07835 [Nanoarchaeota archaeon]|nr:hypothetical protein [Nanoarchaeota archaeon]
MKDNTTERIEMLEKRVQHLEGKHGKNFAVDGGTKIIADGGSLGTEKRCSTLKALFIAAALLCAPYLCVQLENKYEESRFNKEMAEFKQFYQEHRNYIDTQTYRVTFEKEDDVKKSGPSGIIA